jgi:hypothetical protein
MLRCEDVLHEMVEGRNVGGWIELVGGFGATNLTWFGDAISAKSMNTAHVRFHEQCIIVHDGTYDIEQDLENFSVVL